MKAPSILFALTGKADPTFGAGKVYHGIAQAMRTLDWNCKIADDKEILKGEAASTLPPAQVEERMRTFLQQHAAAHDVVEYDCSVLPFPRSDFSAKPLMVARSVLLPLHLARLRFPVRWTLRRVLRQILLGAADRKRLKRQIKATVKTVREADCVNVSNHDDASALVRDGVSPDRVITLPYGLSQTEFDEFSKVNIGGAKGNRVLFLGTFDWRKGAADMPAIFESIARRCPETTFLMLGTKSIFHTADDALLEFPEWLRNKIDVRPRFLREDLGVLLDSANVGVFPSYLEGCPFAVLEQMASGIPTVAYESPGSPMLLPAELLVSPGDTEMMADRVVEMLQDPLKQKDLSSRVRRLAQQFTWMDVAQKTAEAYLSAIADRPRAK